jgi:hypothetical protein
MLLESERDSGVWLPCQAIGLFIFWERVVKTAVYVKRLVIELLNKNFQVNRLDKEDEFLDTFTLQK